MNQFLNDPYLQGLNTYKSLFLKFFFFGFQIGFRPTKGGRLIRLVRRGMRTGQALFPLEIEPDIP